MECKRALQATDGDIQAAIEKMRTKGLAKADKKAGRIAAEGIIVIERAEAAATVVMMEVNCETDFVARGDDFRNFAHRCARLAIEQQPGSVDALYALDMDGQTIDAQRRTLISTIGENIGVRRFTRVDGEGSNLATYTHGDRIGVAVVLAGGDEALARDVALHVAASSPRYVSADDLPAEEKEKERKLLIAQAKESGKPDHIVEKMVEGRLRKHLSDITLLGQPFVKDPDQSVGQLLEKAGAKVVRFERYEVGEGIEKGPDDFAAEVKAQVESVK
jgi:elongation factor Ts